MGLNTDRDRCAPRLHSGLMTSTPLLSHRRGVTTVLATVIAVAAVGTAVLGLHYAGDHSGGRLDTAIDSRLQHRLHGHLRFLHRLVAVADPHWVVVWCAALALLFFLTGRRRAAVLAALGPAIAAGFTEFVLKPLIGRRINDELSFPSGHTTAAVSVVVVVVIVLLGPNRPGWPPWLCLRPSRWRRRSWVRVTTTPPTRSAASASRSEWCWPWRGRSTRFA